MRQARRAKPQIARKFCFDDGFSTSEIRDRKVGCGDEGIKKESESERVSEKEEEVGGKKGRNRKKGKEQEE